VLGRALGGVLVALNVVALSIIFALGVKQFAMPMIATRMYGERYKELVFQCDDVMRAHLIAKNRVVVTPSAENIRALHAAEVGLIECQDYDLLRKQLISYGLTDNDLARLGLQAIEERGSDVRTFVKIHEIKY
jgi:hypothetical protein